jgi:hypothetical protein
MIDVTTLMTGLRRSYRFKLVLLICLVATTGIISRVVYVGSLIWDKYLGDAVYAAVFYLTLALIWKEGTIATKAILTTVYVMVIELFQLTQIPAHLNQSNNLATRAFAYVVLGSAFSWWDILAYCIGTGVALLADRSCLRETAWGE